MAKTLSLTITINPDKSASVEGPIGDKVVAYGMLEVGRDLIQAHHLELERQQHEAENAGSNGSGEKPTIITLERSPAAAAALIDRARQRGGG